MPTPVTMKPILSVPKERLPALVATTPTIAPRIAPQQTPLELKPAKVSLPATTSSGDTYASVRATADSAIHEVSAVLGELLAIPKSLLSSEMAGSRPSPTTADSKGSLPLTPHARSSRGRSSTGPGVLVWPYAAPVLTGLCVYILAPLLVDLLKQRIQFVRRDVNAAKAS
jgi:hypothetical protein